MDGLIVETFTKGLLAFCDEGIDLSWAQVLHCLSLLHGVEGLFEGEDASNLMQCLWDYHTFGHDSGNNFMNHNQ